MRGSLNEKNNNRFLRKLETTHNNWPVLFHTFASFSTNTQQLSTKLSFSHRPTSSMYLDLTRPTLLLSAPPTLATHLAPLFPPSEAFLIRLPLFLTNLLFLPTSCLFPVGPSLASLPRVEHLLLGVVCETELNHLRLVSLCALSFSINRTTVKVKGANTFLTPRFPKNQALRKHLTLLLSLFLLWWGALPPSITRMAPIILYHSCLNKNVRAPCFFFLLGFLYVFGGQFVMMSVRRSVLIALSFLSLVLHVSRVCRVKTRQRFVLSRWINISCVFLVPVVVDNFLVFSLARSLPFPFLFFAPAFWRPSRIRY
jgi:hypothetical protein